MKWKHTLNNLIFLRLVIPFMAGIYLSYKAGAQNTQFVFAAMIVGVTLVLLSVFIRFSIRNRWLYGTFLTLAMICLGGAVFQLQLHQLNIPATYEADKAGFAVQLTSRPVQKAKSVAFDGKVLYHENNQLLNEPLLVYISKEFPDSITEGDIVFANHYVNRISGPANPHQFNYQAYMDRKDIHYQVHLTEGTIRKIRHPAEKKFNLVKSMRNYCVAFIDEHLAPRNEEIARALLLGQKSALDDFTAETFSRSGTMHILAVSGLHVGIIYAILYFFLKHLREKLKYKKWINLIIVIAGIWLFVLLTGAKASVLRAGSMFSLFAIGQYAFPSYNSINTLGGVALILLAFQPFFLFDVGFQMSFSAVLGILLLLPFFSQFYLPDKVGNYFIGICFISVAAQLATLPFVLYYFHQFPLLGLFANLIAVPLALGIVACGFTGFLTASIPVLSDGLGALLNFQINILQASNRFFSSPGFAVVDGLYITPLQVCFLGLFILFVLLYIRTYNRKLFFSSLLFFLLFVCTGSIRKIQATNQEEVYVYYSNNQIIIDHQTGRQSVLYASDSISSSVREYSVKPNHRANYIRSVSTTIYEPNTIFFINGSSFFLIDDRSEAYPAGIDFLLFNHPDNKLLQNRYPEAQVMLANRFKPAYLAVPENMWFLPQTGGGELNDFLTITNNRSQ